MIATLFSNVYVALVVIVFFGVTIFVHEFGHYLVARWCGLVVKTFSIGFGPAIWQREINGVVYKLGWIPFGGYVSLPQLDPAGMSTLQGSEDDTTEGSNSDSASAESFPPVAAWKKILVSVAGATGNVILAIAIAWSVYLIGMPATTASQDTVLGFVAEESDAYAAGLRIGHRLLSVNGVSVTQWSEFIQEAAMYDEVTLVAETPDGQTLTAKVPTEEWQYGIRMVGGVDTRGVVRVGSVAAGMSAEAAGVRPDDIIKTFAGEDVLSRAHLIQLVSKHVDHTVPMDVEREVDGKLVDVTLTVSSSFDADADMPRIGIVFSREQPQIDSSARIHPPPMKQVKHHASAIFRFLRDLLTPKKSAKAANMVGGPVAIITYYVGMIRASIMLAIWFTGFLNINLAVINLLPIPVLDGGHIVFSLYEMVVRKPIKPRIVNALVNAFAVMIIGLFALLSFRDVGRHTPAGRMIRSLFSHAADTNAVEQVDAE